MNSTASGDELARLAIQTGAEHISYLTSDAAFWNTKEVVAALRDCNAALSGSPDGPRSHDASRVADQLVNAVRASITPESFSVRSCAEDMPCAQLQLPHFVGQLSLD